MKSRILLAVTTRVACALLLGVFTSVSSFAQCPVNWVGPFAVSFPLIIYTTTPVCTTTVTLSYCKPGPFVGPPSQYYIANTGITLSPACVDGQFNVIEIDGPMYNQIIRELMSLNPANFPLSACPTMTPEWRVSGAYCYKKVTNPPNVTYVDCPGESRCVEKFEVCRRADGTLQVNSMGKLPGGTCDESDPACKIICN